MQKPSPSALSKLLAGYLEECRGSGSPPLSSSFAIYVGADQAALKAWAEDVRLAAVLRRLDDAAEDSAARALLSGRNATGIIFYLKNKHGWTDARGMKAPGGALPGLTDGEWDALERSAMEARQARLAGEADAAGLGERAARTEPEDGDGGEV